MDFRKFTAQLDIVVAGNQAMQQSIGCTALIRRYRIQLWRSRGGGFLQQQPGREVLGI